MPEPPFFLMPAIFVISVLYASVGHGGASGYLALLSLCGIAPNEMATSALCFNLLVSALAFRAFWKAGHFSSRLTEPFLIASVPCAFIGGFFHVSSSIYRLLLAATLLFAAFRLMIFIPEPKKAYRIYPKPSVALPIGGAIGFVSGIVGVGGGIFLSPFLILNNWADPKRVAATSAAFIWFNSAAALLGRIAGGQWQIGSLLPLVAAAGIGGVIGGRLGANHFSGLTLRRILAALLVATALKIFLT